MPNVEVSVPAAGFPGVDLPEVAVPHGEPLLRNRLAFDGALQELWLALSARPWRSLVLVPAGPAGSVAQLARSLAAVGRELGDAPVAAVAGDAALERGGALDGGAASSRVIVAIPPALIEPRWVVLARRADAVVACIEKGRTRLADVQRTVELIGSERFLGCVMLR
jgi:hypothetical protein